MHGQNWPFYLAEIRRAMAPSTGCTEPTAIALNAATARKEARGRLEHITVTLDPYLYKNAMCVGIPGADERGVALCAAMGATGGNPDALLCVLEGISAQAVDAAKALVAAGRVEVKTREDVPGLFIETILQTDCDAVRVLTLNHHTNIVRVEHAPFAPYVPGENAHAENPLRACKLSDMVVFAQSVPLGELDFLREGIEMNLAVAKAGLKFGLGRAIRTLQEQGVIGRSPVSTAQLLCASASYARMSGVSLPVMTATGSGNQGITLLLTLEAVAQEKNIPEETKLRAAALASLVNIYVKSFTGTLSAVCACGVASGLAASVGVVYMLGGDEIAMLGAMKNILGSISGMICDGAKEGCANKVELSSGLAVQAAFLAMQGMSIAEGDGILADGLESLFENLGHLIREGMQNTNRVIVEIMQGSAACHERLK